MQPLDQAWNTRALLLSHKPTSSESRGLTLFAAPGLKVLGLHGQRIVPSV